MLNNVPSCIPGNYESKWNLPWFAGKWHLHGMREIIARHGYPRISGVVAQILNTPTNGLMKNQHQAGIRTRAQADI